MSTTLTIGLTLLGFLVGFGIAALFSQSRVRNLAATHAARLSDLQKQLTESQEALATTRTALADEQSARQAELDSAQTEAAALTAQLNIVRAQLDEFQAEAGEMEDRLNAAEARVLSAAAEMSQNREELAGWSDAYAQLKTNHARLSSDHREIQERRRLLEEELEARRSEMEQLALRLEALQEAQALQPYSGDLQQSVAAVALARAEAEATLRRRELELTEVRSRLSAMRYSINVLTAAGADLAAQLAAQRVVDADAPLLPEGAARVQTLLPQPPPTVAQEELADLRGVIADWFDEVRGALPMNAATLRAFGGSTAESRLGPPPAAGSVRIEPGEEIVPEQLPTPLMLAAIKAATAASLERSSTRQYTLARELVERQREMDGLSERIYAWRTMLYVTLQNEPDLLRLLEEPRATSSSDLLAACATVALSAYQKRMLSAPPPPPAPAPAAEPPLLEREPAETRALLVREWRPVRRAR